MDGHGQPTAIEAAAWLDVRYPGWAEKIDTELLDMSSSDRCIAGQMGIHWEILTGEFDRDTDNFDSQVFATYESEWIEQVEKRRVLVPA